MICTFQNGQIYLLIKKQSNQLNAMTPIKCGVENVYTEASREALNSRA